MRCAIGSRRNRPKQTECLDSHPRFLYCLLAGQVLPGQGDVTLAEAGFDEAWAGESSAQQQQHAGPEGAEVAARQEVSRRALSLEALVDVSLGYHKRYPPPRGYRKIVIWIWQEAHHSWVQSTVLSFPRVPKNGRRNLGMRFITPRSRSRNAPKCLD